MMRDIVDTDADSGGEVATGTSSDTVDHCEKMDPH